MNERWRTLRHPAERRDSRGRTVRYRAGGRLRTGGSGPGSAWRPSGVTSSSVYTIL